MKDVNKILRRIGVMLLAAAGILIFSENSPAQSADTLVAQTLRNHPGLKALKRDLEAEGYRENGFQDLPDPMIEIGFAPIPLKPMMGTERFRIGVMQSLPWNNVLKNRAAVAREEARQIKYDYEIRKADLSLAVRRWYAQIWKLDREMSLLEQRIPIIEAWHEVALSLMTVNKGNASDVLQIQVFMNEIQNSLELLQQEKDLYRLQLERVTGTDEVEVSSRMETDTSRFFRLTREAQDLRIEDLPDLQRYEQEIAVSNAVLERNKTEGLPELSIGLEYGVMDVSGTSSVDYKGMSMVMPMVSVSLPVFRQKYKIAAQMEKSRQVAIGLRKEERRREIREEIGKAEVVIRQENRNLIFYRKQLEILERTIDMMQARYSAEGEQFDELLKLQNKRIDLELQELESRVKIYLAGLSIDRWQP